MSELIRVAVLMGGPSQEHDISLKSGNGVAQALRLEGFVVEQLSVPRSSSREEAIAWTKGELLRAQPAVAFITLHGAFGEDGTVQALCEELRLPYTGSDVRASRLGMDKLVSRERFIEAGLLVPRSHTVAAGSWNAAEVAELKYPLVAKPIDQGSSIGVSLVKSPADLALAVQEAAQYGERVLIEEYIHGQELTVGVLGTRALPVIEVIPKHTFFDFTAKYTAGLTEYRVPADLSQMLSTRIQAVGWRAHQALGCRHLSRTDLILDAAGRCFVLEVNTIPGFTPTSLLPKAALCVGISYPMLCRQIVEMALKARRPAAVSAAKGA